MFKVTALSSIVLFLLGCSSDLTAQQLTHDTHSETRNISAAEGENQSWSINLTYPIFKHSEAASNINKHVEASIKKYECPEKGDHQAKIEVAYSSPTFVSMKHHGATMCADMPRPYYYSENINIDVKLNKLVTIDDLIKKERLAELTDLTSPKINQNILDKEEYQACTASIPNDFYVTTEGILFVYTELVQELPYPCEGAALLTKVEVDSFLSDSYKKLWNH